MPHRRLIAPVVLALTLAGCSATQVKEVWTRAWYVAATPVLATCTPYSAAWDGGLDLVEPHLGSYGLTRVLWEEWSDGVTGQRSTWGAPLLLFGTPLFMVLQPLPTYLLGAAAAHAGG